MHKYCLFIGGHIILMGVIAIASIWNGKATTFRGKVSDKHKPSASLRDVNKKLCIHISLRNPNLDPTVSNVARVRITNCSDVTVGASDYDGILFSFSKRPLENRNRVVIQDLFHAGFLLDEFTPINPAYGIPKELKSKDSFEFEVDLSKGVWRDSVVSNFNIDQEAGLIVIPKGKYYVSAEIRLVNSCEGERKVSFQSNEVEVDLYKTVNFVGIR